jgi:hypothetical protein
VAQIPASAVKLLGAAMAAFRFGRLRRADPPPLGLASPLLRPVMLGGESWDRHGLLEVTLVHGDPAGSSAPLVEVTTNMSGTVDVAPEQVLADLAHRDAAAGRGDWLDYDDHAAADPAGPVTFSDASIFVEGQPAAVTVLSYRHYQAAVFACGGMTGAVGSRHCPLDQLRLARVPSIEPYLAGYTAFLSGLARQWRRRGT